MKYIDLKQAKATLDEYKIADLKMLDKEIESAYKEYQDGVATETTTKESEIADLQVKIQTAESNLIAVPVGVDERVVQLINEKNAIEVAMRDSFVKRIEEINNTMSELKSL